MKLSRVKNHTAQKSILRELHNVKNKDLVYFGERTEPYFASHLIISGMQNKVLVKKFFGWKNTVRWIQLNYYFFRFATDLKKVESELKHIFHNKSTEYTSSLIKNCLKTGNRTIKLSEKFSEQGRKETNPKKLTQLLKKYFIAISHYTVFYNLAMFENPIMEIAKDVVKRNSSAGQDNHLLLELITTPNRKNAAEFEQEAFLKIAAAPKKLQKKLAKNHADKFGWLATLFFLGNKWTTRDVTERLDKISAFKAGKILRQKQIYKKNLSYKIAKAFLYFNANEKKIVELIRGVIYLRTLRADLLSEIASKIRPLLDKIALLLKVPYEDLINLSIPEIIKALEGKFDYKTHINKRKKNLLIYHNPTQIVVLEDIEVEKYFNNHAFLNLKKIKISSLIGKPAFLGKVVGRAKLVKSTSDINKVMKGDILISVMTTPNFLPALEKAAGFVTDEGGITSHVAVIARELKKPCIIGTKIATKIFKDGDLVEVDANKGVVQKLN